MAKRITKIVLTGGPAAGKTTLVSRVLKEFKQEDGWRVITIPETATELISGFGIKPFDNCMSMMQFQDFVVADQIHKEKLALDAAQLVPEDNILILYDRALMDDKAYVSDEEFAQVIARFDGRTEERVLANYDMVLHLITCAKGAEFAYDLGNNARTESIEFAREMDDRTLRAWSAHPNLRIIDNDANFNNKIERALREIYLKGFEICVKTAHPFNIMTSYNKINGVWGHYHYGTCTQILRGEWEYDGCVMTDWWMRASKDPDFPLLRNNAYRVRGQVDVLMPGAGAGSRKAKYDPTLLESLGKPDGITRAEIFRSAMNTLRFVLRSHPFCAEHGLDNGYRPGPDWFECR